MKNHPNKTSTLLKSLVRTLLAIGVVIDPIKLLIRSRISRTCLRRREKTSIICYLRDSSSFLETQEIQQEVSKMKTALIFTQYYVAQHIKAQIFGSRQQLKPC